MSNRSVRVNELIKREVSDILHTVFRTESVYITITAADISPDLRNGRIYYSVLGGEDQKHQANRFLKRALPEVKRLLGKNVILKYMPKISFVYDESIERGNRTIDNLNELDQEG